MSGTKAALITGGARRIGAAIALELALNGYAVAIHCRRSRAEADALVARIRSAGGNAAIVGGNLAHMAALERIVPDAVAAVGPLTLLVNNASVFLPDRFGALDPARWQEQFDINLRAPVFLAEAFAARARDDEDCSIVNMIDQRVLKLTPDMASYTLTKSALWTATQTLAQALAPRVRVNAVAPGPTFPNERDGAGAFGREAAALPLARAVDPVDIGRSVRFLAETPSVTGQLLVVDSGQHLGWRTPDIVSPDA